MRSGASLQSALSQAEAVMDVVTAEAEQSLKAALLQLEGSVSRLVSEIETRLLDALAGIDAAIDYPDEAEADMTAALPEALARALQAIHGLIEGGLRGRVLRDGLRMVIIGRPNVGKSSLMNALLGEERAIVTAAAGTTRDLLDGRLSIEGVPVRVIDTAGIREADSEAERIGVDRARAALRTADVVCVALDGSEPLTPEDRALLEDTRGMTRLLLLNKCDLPERAAPDERHIRVSARTGEGLEDWKKAILALAAPERADAGLITNERHIRALENAAAALQAAQRAGSLDLAATDIREALHELGAITGSDVDADVIERIFARFCVGK
ncbi:MAG: 50S ribosome-binding GTPase [Clostridia bacterium]|nr:50S ribosome-binding GTPase [Clostridia bacterium]